MTLRMVGLSKNKNGEFAARKGIPADVRDAYCRLYGVRWEAKFKAPAGTSVSHAKAQYAEWTAEIETRIATLRAD
jgi:hypothetical protein